MKELELLTKKIVVITGANAGIGKATALGLAELEATIVMICRDQKRGQAALEEIKDKSGNSNIDLLIADLSSQQQIRKVVEEFKDKYTNLHILINNAGVVLPKRELTVDGFEYQFAVNYLAPFLLTNLLLDVLKASVPARIINVASYAHKLGSLDFEDLQCEKKYGPFRAYGQSKLALIMFTYELANRLEGTDITVNALHPGAIRSDLARHFNWFIRGFYSAAKIFMKGTKKGAETSIYLAASPEVEGTTGKYFSNKKEKKSSKESYDIEATKKLWEISCKLTGLSD